MSLGEANPARARSAFGKNYCGIADDTTAASSNSTRGTPGITVDYSKQEPRFVSKRLPEVGSAEKTLTLNFIFH